MTAFSPVTASRGAGVNNAAALTAVTANDTFPAGPNTYFRVKNASAVGDPLAICHSSGSCTSAAHSGWRWMSAGGTWLPAA